MRRIYAVLTLAIPFTALLGGCAGERDEQEQRLAAMQTEIEQLTNAFGRLEFRLKKSWMKKFFSLSWKEEGRAKLPVELG